jgi:hypothetical protein
LIALSLLATAVRLHELRIPAAFYATLSGAAAASVLFVVGAISVFGANAFSAAIGAFGVLTLMVLFGRNAGWITDDEWSALGALNIPGGQWVIHHLQGNHDATSS